MTAKKKGGRLGPFQLGKRYKHASAELGHIHEARNVQTGAPALVMMPGPRPSWGPKKNWRMRASVQSAPPFIALEVDQAPATGRLAELANQLTLLLTALEAVGSNPRMRAHLTGSPMGQWVERPWSRGLVVAGLALLMLAGGLWWGMGTRPVGSPPPPPSTSGIGELADAGLPSPFMIDGEARSPAGISYPLPNKPFSNQAKPPCLTGRDEVAINGGCWVEIARRPPCHEEQAEYKGKCYLPVSTRGPRPPQSLSP